MAFKSALYTCEATEETRGEMARVLEITLPEVSLAYGMREVQVMPKTFKAFVTVTPMQAISDRLEEIDERLWDYGHFMICQQAARDVTVLLTVHAV